MRYLSYQIIFFLFTISIFAQSPHGDNFDIDCSNCHTADSWKVDLSKISFDHSKTNFSLIGQHINVDCKSCHESLVFSKMDKDCFSCHKDIHQGTVGLDCASCHTPTTWIVKDIIGLHQNGRFPLLGAHQTADCSQCHSGYPQLNFEPLNIDCYACHKQNYESTQNPNHVAANFSTECQDCHNVSALSWKATNIDHSFFPLVGGHALPSCFSCHQQGGDFSGLSQECYSCHQQTYEATQNPNHIAAGMPTTCEVCHSIQGWTPAQFNHDLTAFPLTGKHIDTDCANCHTTGYTGTPTDCYACHQQDYQNTTDPNHLASQFPTDCTLCHNTADWNDATFDHNQSNFPLTGAHTTTTCQSCHQNGYTGTPTDCLSCHQTNYNNTTNPNHTTVSFPTTCVDCHSTAAWAPATFDHDNQYFPIYSGKHKDKWNQCSECHTTPSNYSQFSCIDCHEHNKPDMDNDHQGVQGYIYSSPDCLSCHPQGNKDGAFNHATSSFPLTGSHLTANCADCHQNGYAGTTSVCSDCHISSYNTAVNPNHSAAGLSTECSTCHNANGWSPSTFDHSTTGFALLGSHQPLQCSGCHNGTTTGLQSDCVSCHQTDYNQAANHTAQSYPTNCEQCHNSVNWNEATFDHQNTSFPLTGAHTSTTCQSCHQNGYTGTPTDCLSCHQTDYNNTTNPNHTTVSFPTTCVDCHSTAAWAPATFDHDNQYFPIYSGEHKDKWTQCSECHTTPSNYSQFSCIDCHEHNKPDMDNDHQGVQGYIYSSPDCLSCHPQGKKDGAFNHATSSFPLTGSHLTANCADCHQNGYAGTTSVCSDCHTTEYNSASNPNHQTLSISTDCSICHTPTADWQPALFPQHDQVYQLLGRHAEIANDCASCHNGNYTTTQNQCVECHQSAYNASVNPNHSAAGLSTECSTCHNANGWSPSTFDHSTTGFTLLGSHQPLQCSGCHTGTTTGLTSDCVSCHQVDYNQAANHTAQSYPTNCEQCHNSVNWNEATFNHQNTSFPLTGAHTTTTCQSCHQTGFAGTPTDCYACHTTDFNNTVNPDHQTAGIPTACVDCHSTTAWQPATFDHQNTGFPLTGAHISASCQSCHQSGYTNTPTDCFACHTTDYNNTTNPNHIAANFPTTCVECHSTSAWTPATFDHDNQYFPIYSGKHKDKWNQCSECHTTPNNYSLFSCIDCHEHNRTDMDQEHQGVNNYVYNSINCYDCHPDGQDRPVVFNHTTTEFPLTGAHTNVECSQCHSTKQDRISSECVACHMQDYLNTVNPNHQAAGISTDCISCHSANNWSSGIKLFEEGKALQ